MAGSNYTLVVTFRQGPTSRIVNITSEAQARSKWAKLKKHKGNPPESGYIEAPDGTKIPLD